MTGKHCGIARGRGSVEPICRGCKRKRIRRRLFLSPPIWCGSRMPARRCVKRRRRLLFVPLQIELIALRNALQAQTVTLDNLPPDLKSQWVAADGKARAQASPKGDTNSTEILRNFARAVLGVYPDAVGGPISILKPVFRPRSGPSSKRGSMRCC